MAAFVELQHEQSGGRWRLRRSRTTFFDEQHKSKVRIDAEYADPEFAVALRTRVLDVTKRYAGLVLPDELHAAEDESGCWTEAGAALAASAFVVAQGLAVGAALAALGSVEASLAALMTNPVTSIAAAIAARAAVTAAQLALAKERTTLAGYVALAVAADLALWNCLHPPPPPPPPPSGGGGGGGHDGGGGGGGGGGGVIGQCEFWGVYSSSGNFLYYEDPNMCLVNAA